ncbi:MAG: hypothetical protein R3282_00215 [Rhodothermales bacterium]|nr:hypothetical protein [Rhodothermales bacterium]
MTTREFLADRLGSVFPGVFLIALAVYGGIEFFKPDAPHGSHLLFFGAWLLAAVGFVLTSLPFLFAIQRAPVWAPLAGALLFMAGVGSIILPFALVIMAL